MNLRKILLKTYQRPTSVLSAKFMLEGKSYKISLKKSSAWMRFNRANRTILALQNVSFLNKNGRKSVYVHNAMLSAKPLASLLFQIRKTDTYTLRGL
jgi:rRNA pseudouridine-1189 N-methylase Emg1 (Nep1/Mra1 family)